jgi:hypothetical protein
MVATEAVMQQGLRCGRQGQRGGHRYGHFAAATVRRRNADTPYAISTLDLRAAGPMVVELPAGPCIGFVHDHNMRGGRNGHKLCQRAANTLFSRRITPALCRRAESERDKSEHDLNQARSSFIAKSSR